MRRRLICWKDRVCKGTFGHLGCWLKRQKQTCFKVSCCVVRRVKQADDRIKAAKMVHDFWTAVGMQESVAHLTLLRLLLVLVISFVSVAVTSFADGWDGYEVKYIPEQAIHCLHERVLGLRKVSRHSKCYSPFCLSLTKPLSPALSCLLGPQRTLSNSVCWGLFPSRG